MDSRHRRRPTSDRFLTAFTSPAASYSSSGDAAGELTEDDIFLTGADFSNPPSTSSTSLLNQSSNSNKRTFNPENFGILAVLPEFNQKPQQSSSTMTIPITRRNSGNISELLSNSSSMPAKYHQSAPVKVPMMQVRERRRRRKGSAFGYEDVFDDDDEEDEGEMLPPHEIVARKMPKSPMLSCSVLEGVGRTLKGRDLRQVRNAVFRQTGKQDNPAKAPIRALLMRRCHDARQLFFEEGVTVLPPSFPLFGY